MIQFAPLLLALGLVISLSGCGSESTSNNGWTSPPPKVGTPSVKPLPSEYRVLAENLALDMKASTDQFRDGKGLSEIISEVHSAVIALQGIDSQDAEIAYIAEQGHSACKDTAVRIDRINLLPKPPDGGTLFVGSFIGGFYSGITGDPSGLVAGYAAEVDAGKKQNAINAEVQGLLAAVDKADAAHMMLPRVAQKYAATPSDANGRIVVDIDESWGWVGPNDWFCVYNAGPALEDCTIQVHLTGGTGQTRKNVHFVRHWPANSWMYARYEPGQKILDRPEAGKMTVTEIQKADVSIWSPTYTTTLTYAYQGAEKDKDIAERCKDLKFTGLYKPFVSGILWDDERGAEFTLDGVAGVPKCRVDVTFRKGSQSKAFHWEHDYWMKGEKKSFNTSKGNLTFDPSHIDMAISFPGTSYKHEVTLTVNK